MADREIKMLPQTPSETGGSAGRLIDKQSDRYLLDEVLRLTPSEAAAALHRSRQALYAALSPDSKLSRLYFKPSELRALYIAGARKHARDLDRRTFLEFVERTRGSVITEKVRDLLKPQLGELDTLAFVLPDYPGLRDANILARDAIFDLLSEATAPPVTLYFPGKEDAKLFLSDWGRVTGAEPRADVRLGSPIAAIPPLAIVTRNGRAKVFGISRGKLKQSDFFGGSKLLDQLSHWTSPCSLDEPGGRAHS